MARDHGGFTLLEVLIALSIAGLVAVTAHQIFAAATDAGRRLLASRAALDRFANARRYLQAAFLSLEVGSDSAGPFEGSPHAVRFTTWQQTPDGPFAQRRLVLSASGDSLFARPSNGLSVLLSDSITALDFDYLLKPGADTEWVRQWISPVSAPLAIRMRVARRERTDTLLFLVLERG